MFTKIRLARIATVGLLLLLVGAPAYAQTYTMTLKTSAPSYVGTAPIYISGTITPAPGPNTGVIITIRNAQNAIADVNEVPVLSNGSYSWTSFPGANSYWTSGTFAVNATWGNGGSTLSQIVTFTYTAAATTSTTSQTSVTNATSSTVAEFPSGAVSLVALAVIGVVAVLSRKAASPPRL